MCLEFTFNSNMLNFQCVGKDSREGSMSSWLPLLNYSTKYNISLSTLRRRIKAKTIEFRLDQGKYLILDEGAQMPLTPPDESFRRKESVTQEHIQDVVQEVSRNLNHS